MVAVRAQKRSAVELRLASEVYGAVRYLSLRTNWFIVIRSNGRWWVDNEGHAFGPFPTREIAALEALEFARKLGDHDRVSQIYWPDDDGKLKLIRELPGAGA